MRHYFLFNVNLIILIKPKKDPLSPYVSALPNKKRKKKKKFSHTPKKHPMFSFSLYSVFHPPQTLVASHLT